MESLDIINLYKVMIVKLSGCVNLESNRLKKWDDYLMKLFHILALRGDKIPSVLLVPVMSNSNKDSCVVIEEIICLL